MLPLVGEAIHGCDSYVTVDQLPTTNISKRWLYRGTPRSVQWRGRDMGIVKTLEPFQEQGKPPITREAMTQLLRECETRGVERPSSYGSLFHDRVSQPMMSRELRKMFPRGIGGWQELRNADLTPSRAPVRCTQPVRLYDLKSAYLWSLSQGLPHPDTFRAVKRLSGPGLYWCISPAWELLPHPWNLRGMFPVTTDELHVLPIPTQNVLRGIIYTPGTLDTSSWVKEIQAWSCHKAVGRSFWGRWIAQNGLSWETFKNDQRSKIGEQLDYLRNPVWGCIITARVRLRLWDTARHGNVLRVHVDSVVTTQQIETGDKIGDWVEKEAYQGLTFTGHRGIRLAA